MIEKILIAIVVIAPLLYFWVFWLNPMAIKNILLKKGFGIDYVKTHLKKYYMNFYSWIPGILLK